MAASLPLSLSAPRLLTALALLLSLSALQGAEGSSVGDKGMRLRGGQTGIMASSKINVLQVGSGQMSHGSSSVKKPTAFTKVIWKRLTQEDPKSVEVVGSWSSFKTRHPMSKAQNGDWEIIMELPKGEHQVKFVIDGAQWRCHPELESKKDSSGVENNIIKVDTVPSHNKADKSSADSQMRGGGAEVYQPAQESINIALDMVSRLETENRIAQEKLAKANSQLVETLKGELSSGMQMLESKKNHVQGFTQRGSQGLLLIKQAGDAKIAEIKAHMAKIKEILDEKEKIATQMVVDNLNHRLETLESELTEYKQVTPGLSELAEEAQMALKRSQTDPSAFIQLAQSLLPKIESSTSKAAALQPPTDDAKFDHLKLNLLPQT